MRLSDALRSRPVLLDGGLATWLEATGHDLRDELWSARLLADDPAAIVAAHRAYLDAGASVVTTATYQATVAGFVGHGHSRAEAARLIRSGVDLARTACAPADPRPTAASPSPLPGRPLWIAASVGPYGAALADGSEYRGGYGLSHADLVRFHRPRMALLADAGPDVLALETVPDIREAEALLAALDGLGVPAWLSYTIDGERTRAGQPLAEAFALAAGRDDIIAVGVNCCDPEDATAAVSVAAHASAKPVVVYPNSGEHWDATARAWVGAPVGDPVPRFAALASRWLDDGARLIGGCCRVGPTTIADLADTMAVRELPRADPVAPPTIEHCPQGGLAEGVGRLNG
jgi:homocysteine S-methyltransferase